ncbi:transglycosylase SLT domain-containing protein [Halorhodospira halochloris]|uniref:Membrane-bound lytic murein transglycosylase C n=1 Tax=Halorhodospira halochloris TaxID=1052 RepID=A0A110B121_HALHR|nr:transglycosylase SLT domain-containing protein [Halorhodospira halochloris]MBK1650964.1 hypothetical protein [Halorhodospira halochloris]MCG5529330.1 transglycosylase SLT domain-containing protein [Halorhodospira halochloris]BAU56530.1 membrane-bound lytic murein transglycosylase C precursor [Halorhodospira halochloris]
MARYGLIGLGFGVAVSLVTVPMLAWSEVSAFERFQQQRQQAFEQHQSDFQEAFQEFQDAFHEEFAAYQEELRANWREPRISDRHRWVEYSDDQSSRTVVDYEENSITIDVPSEAGTQGVLSHLNDLLGRTMDEAYDRDEVTQRTQQRVGLGEDAPEAASDQRVLSEIKPEDLDEMISQAELEEREEPKGEESRSVISLTVPMPEQRPSRKVEEFREQIRRHAERYEVEEALMIAIMHSESSFNPMARSHIPAFGLMQIVPQTAGKDVAQRVYGEMKLLSPEYLYNPENNIQAGAVYLNILFYSYLSAIEDPESRMYAVIAAYNTGAGNVARAFVDGRNIRAAARVINDLTPHEVYERLLADLPYDETRNYLVHVASRTEAYRNF